MFLKRQSDKKNVSADADMFHLDELNAKSNAELLMEIEKMMDPPLGEEIDTDKVERYLALLQERAPVMEDYNPAAQWDKLMEDHPLLVEEEVAAPEESFGAKQPHEPSGRAAWLRPLRMAEIAVAAVLCLVVTANAFGVNPIQTFLNWADGVIQIYSNPSGVMELPADDPSEYHSLEQALAANGIDTDNCPTWVPRDYTLRTVKARAIDGFSKYSANYNAERGDLLIRVTQATDPLWVNAEERDNNGYIYERNGVEYYIVANVELCKAGWKIGKCSYVISGHITEEEIKQMIDSIS